MPVKRIHVLPVGFDIHRLTAPLTSDEFSVDQVVLLHSTEDKVEEGRKTPTDELVTNALNTTKSNIENFVDVPVEVWTIPPLHDYRQVYTRAYELLRELSNQGTVHVNVSSLPLAAASAFVNAEGALSTEGDQSEEPTSSDAADFPDEYTDRGDRLQTYYIRPDEYVEAELVDHLQNRLPSVLSRLENDIGEYEELESGLFYGLAKPVHHRVNRLQELLDQAEQELESASPDQRSDAWNEEIGRCKELLDELTDLGPEKPFSGPITRQVELE